MPPKSRVALLHGLGVVAFAGADAHQQPVAALVLMPQQELCKRCCLVMFLDSLTGGDTEEILQERLHDGDHTVRVQLPGEEQSLGHAFFAGGEQRRAPTADAGPAVFLLVVNKHALVFHLLHGHLLLLHKEELSALPPQTLQDGALREFLFVHAVFKPEPEQVVKLVGPPVPFIAEEEVPQPRQVQPFLHEAHDHVEVLVRVAVGEKGHEGRVKVVTPGGVPDDIACPAGRAGVILFDHVGKTTSRVRSAGMRALITSRMRPRS